MALKKRITVFYFVYLKFNTQRLSQTYYSLIAYAVNLCCTRETFLLHFCKATKRGHVSIE